jgi:outer membrane lipopolysaccharide assembly protein LptE/RlpB
MMRIQYIWIVAGGLIAAILTACGYHFAGGGSFPAGVTRIFISMLENRTTETGVERVFTNDLIYEFTRSRKESLAKDRASANGILTGTISRLAVQNISRTSVSQATERRVTGTLNLRLESPDGRLLWKSGEIIEREAYDVDSENKTATDQNKADAIAELSKKMAESAFSRLTDDF